MSDAEADRDLLRALQVFLRSRGKELSNNPADSLIIPTKGPDGSIEEVPMSEFLMGPLGVKPPEERP